MKCRWCGSEEDVTEPKPGYFICLNCKHKVSLQSDRKKQQEQESHQGKKHPGRPTTVKGMVKKCAKCQVTKSLSEFYYHAKRRVYTSYCNDCRREYQRTRNSRSLEAESQA